MTDEVQPYPSKYAINNAQIRHATHGDDPRFACWFCGDPSVAIAPRHSGGDLDVPAHWLPVCEHHCEHWHDEVDAAERMPIIPRNGVVLSKEQAETLYTDLRYDMDNGRYDAATTEAYDAIEAALRTLNEELES